MQEKYSLPRKFPTPVCRLAPVPRFSGCPELKIVKPRDEGKMLMGKR